MAKVISTIIEDEVVFMKDADVEFVSLVKHGANRTPFKILKSEDKENNLMSKVLTAVLIPKSMDEEAAAKFLEGCRTDEVREYDTFKSYIQVVPEAYDPDTVQVARNAEDNSVLYITAALKEDSGIEDPKTVEKEALDYATMDSLYEELYAMADIVSGTMRQANIEPAMRKKTILVAIDNFKAFTEMLLKSIKEEDIVAVKAEDHPDIAVKVEAVDAMCPDCEWMMGLAPGAIEMVVHKGCENPMVKAEEKEEKADPDEKKSEKSDDVCSECGHPKKPKDPAPAAKVDDPPPAKADDDPPPAKKDDDPPAADPPAFDAAAFKTDLMKEVVDGVGEVVAEGLKETKKTLTGLGESIGGVKTELDLMKEAAEADTTKDTLTELGTKLEALAALPETVATLAKDVDTLKKTPKTSKTDVSDDDDPPAKEQKKFSGTLFQRPAAKK